MNPFDHYFSSEVVNESIRLGYIDIDLFVKKYLELPNIDHFRREKGRLFNPKGPLSCYFDDADFEKINGFRILKKQIEWMGGKIAVKKLVRTATGLKENLIRISARESGVPYLPDFPDINISITHSGQFAVAGIGLSGSSVAIDIELIEENRMANIGRVAFSPKELDRLKGKDDKTHYIFWTVKEAFLKYIGKGFSEGLKKVEFLDGCIFHHGKKVDGITVSSRVIHNDYAFTLIY